MDDSEQIPHASLLTWMELEREFDVILREAGVPDGDLRELFDWGQQKWIEYTDRDLAVLADGVIDTGVEGVYEVMRRARTFYTNMVMRIFTGLLLARHKIMVLERELGEGE